MAGDATPPATGADAAGSATDDAAPAARLLVVEDDTLNRRLLARGVEREGHVARTAAHGGEALDILAREPIDLVLLDLLMPEVDGFAVLDAMRADPDLRRIPVIVISAVEDTASVARAIGMGAIDVLAKPFDPVLLRVRLRTALEQARLRGLEQAYVRQELALRQQEKLATLGRLSAGLAHELNNPAAAAQRTAQRLHERIEEVLTVLPELVARPDAADLLAVGATLPVAGAPAGASAVDRLDAEDAVEAALAALGVAHPQRSATRLVAVGLTPATVEATLAGVAPDAADVAVRWLAARLDIRGAIAQLASSIGRISTIIGALRSYSYLDRAPQQDVDVRTGLEDSLTMLAHELADGITVVRDHDPELPRIDAHGSQLNQVWTNLLDNAIDALDGHGTITVRTRAAGDGVVVEVEDDGPGIPASLRPRIFDPFVTTKGPGEGTGLGLNISHQIVTDVHGGRLSVASEPGRTTFTVQLPPRPPAPGPGEDAPEGSDGR